MNATSVEAVDSQQDFVIVDSDAFCQNASTTVADILQFNFSGYDYPGGDGPRSPPLDVISALKIAFCIINMTVSILGNTAVMIAVYHNPALRSNINYYLVSLFKLYSL